MLRKFGFYYIKPIAIKKKEIISKKNIVWYIPIQLSKVVLDCSGFKDWWNVKISQERYLIFYFNAVLSLP